MDYLVESARTLPPGHQFHGELVPAHVFRGRLDSAISAIRDLDVIKKAFFYGKDKDGALVKSFTDSSIRSCHELPDCQGKDARQKVINIIHGIIGVATEAGELLEALESIVDGNPIDAVNLKEEVGDHFWYDAILCRELGFTFDEAQVANINKLYKRFPERFTENHAINRDTDAERTVLERHFGEEAVLQSEAEQPGESANLGYATTGELIDELRARVEVNGTVHYSTMHGYDRAPPNSCVPADTPVNRGDFSMPYQYRVDLWMDACFGDGIKWDVTERCDRMIEEVFELAQSLSYDPTRIPTLVEYVFSRKIGEKTQELGGVMVTIAALANATYMNMTHAAEVELARVWTKVDQIREKQKGKPGAHSPLPGHSAPTLSERIVGKHPALGMPYQGEAALPHGDDAI